MYEYKLPSLPYEYNALEPFIDELTMKTHHTKHHQTYVDKLNAALKDHPDLHKKSLEELVRKLDAVPDAIRTAVRNHGGGHLNHSFFWKVMTGERQNPSGEIAGALDKKFGGFDKFKETFSASALGVFGSGWCWLVASNGSLEIITTPNQDSPL
ncbi:MAG: superoxide dismutase, partial [Candidatus Anstonellaceae archaeon]